METNLITPRFQNFLTIGVFIVGWALIAILGSQIWRRVAPSASSNGGN